MLRSSLISHASIKPLWSIVFVILVSLPTDAQTFAGAVVGRVVDAQHAVIANAHLVLGNSDQGYERSTTTNSQGEYSFQLVPPGEFTLRGEATGFAPASVKVEVVVATTIRADLALGIQSLQQTVNVVGENGVAVQTESADLGRTISPHEMSELPSLTRSPYDFIALMPGATISNDLLGVGFAVNGARTQSANYLLDGSENNDTFMSAPAQDIPLDSIEEFSVQTNHYSAEFGRNSGFTANIVTKTGTNSFHGSLYEYLRNSALAANTYNNKANGFPRPFFIRNQFGGTIGGPIRQKKAFFFASIEPILVRSSTTNSFYVPTPQLLSISAPGTHAIFQHYPLPTDMSSFDVLSTTVCPYGTTCNSKTGMVTIPGFASASRVGPQDVGAGPPQNTILATGRIDWLVTPKMQALVRYAVEDQDVFAIVTQPYSSSLDYGQGGRNQNISFNLIGTWSPRWTTESRIVYSRVVGTVERFGGNSSNVVQFPAFSIQTEPAILPMGLGVFDGLANFYQFYQTNTFSHGHHLFKFGGQFVRCARIC
jgi:hypothetical protein